MSLGDVGDDIALFSLGEPSSTLLVRTLLNRKLFFAFSGNRKTNTFGPKMKASVQRLLKPITHEIMRTYADGCRFIFTLFTIAIKTTISCR